MPSAGGLMRSAGARSQRRAEHVRRREDVGGADLNHRRPVQRVVGQRIERPGETEFADNERAGCIGVIARIGDHRPRLP